MCDRQDAVAKSVIDAVIDLDGDARAARIERCCAGDADLRRRVERLLAAIGADDRFLAEPTLAPPAPVAAGDRPGAQIGPYTLVELIGEGGFGAVFLAEQSHPVARRVALKIIKAGMDTRQVIARFEAERQALALMDHANIARVLDAGATDGGQPYFVMELVRGEPVTRHCDGARLSVRQRLGLFRDICSAVQHAHQKGVIHRDLKPSNILVTRCDDGAVVKVIDFGIAKATAARSTDQRLTQADQVVGTPEYMSPEQADAAGNDIDTRSDVYSLGVVLYELLTGTTPFDRQRLAASGVDGIRRIIREEEPLRPSTRLQALAASSAQVPLAPHDRGPGPAGCGSSSIIEIADRRRTEPAALVRTLRRELDWIVLKCLEKERTRRYETVGALADDIGRYLGDQPVRAAPPSAGYRLRKFARRNRAAVAAGALVAGTLLAASGVAVAFGVSEARQRAMAERARAQLEQVADFQADQLASIDVQALGAALRQMLSEEVRESAQRSNVAPQVVEARVAALHSLIQGSDFTGLAVAALEQHFFRPTLTAIDERFADQPLVRARLLQTLAATLRDLGLLEAARGPQEAALTLRRGALGADHPDTLAAQHSLAVLLHNQGHYSEAEAGYQAALAGRRRVLGADHRKTLESSASLGMLLHAQGRLAEAEQRCAAALAGQRRVLGSDHPDTLASIQNLAYLLKSLGRLSEAEPYGREVLARRRRLLGDEHPDTLGSMNNLGALLVAQGRPEEAERHYRAALAGRRRVLGDGHPDTFNSMNNLGHLLKVQGKLAEAGQCYAEALAGRRRVLGDEHPHTLNSITNLGMLLLAQDRLSEAEPYLREALASQRRVQGSGHPHTIKAVGNLGALLKLQGKLDEAEPCCREALETSLRVLGSEHPDTIAAYVNLAGLLQARGDDRGVLELLGPVTPVARRVSGHGNVLLLARWLTMVGRAHAAGGGFDAAEECLIEADSITGTAPGAADAERSSIRLELVALYEAWHRADPAGGHDGAAREWRRRVGAAAP